MNAIQKTNTNMDSLLKKYDNIIENINNSKTKKEQHWNKYKNNTTYFIGPKVVSMTLKDIQKNNSNSLIGKDYSITDKADGLGMIMYVVGSDHLSDEDTKRILDNDNVIENRKLLKLYEGAIYLIDQNFKIYKTNLQFKDTLQTKFKNTVLNGEYLHSDKLENPIHMYKIYDNFGLVTSVK